MDSHGTNDSGDCPAIDWAAMTSTIPHHGLDDLPSPVRDFYLVGQVVANAAVCRRHKLYLLTGYLNALDDASYRCIAAVCEPDLSKAPGDMASADNCLAWVERLAAQWPLPASIFAAASMSLLVESDVWAEAFFLCAGCMSVPGPIKDDTWQLLGLRASNLIEDGFFMVDGFHGEFSEDDLLAALGVDFS